ncbi:hypothetical protein OH77DRAFT_1426580 [Trametes cingulata]|nr:hypothetical protein OH77DRAFT_1426580 [Trametes cingulata]
MSNTDYNTSTNNAETDATRSGGQHRKIRGAAEVVEGIGHTLSGRIMSAVDSGKKAGGTHPEVQKGQKEIEHGMARLTGGPGVNGTAHAAPTSSSTNSTVSDTPTASAPLAQEGNALGPTSAMTAGINAGPETAVAEGPYQPQFAASGAGPDSAPPFQQGSNDRDFPAGAADEPHEPPIVPQQGATPGPAPDRNTLSRDPQRLA